MKAMKGSVRKKPSANFKSNGRWLWFAITVGKDNQVFTHDNGLKRVAFRLLPRRADAVEGTPRGLEDIASTLHDHVRRGTFLVHDGWTSTKSAVTSLGYKSAPPVVHTSGYRDASTGFHTNDAESENSRLKRWNRNRYGRLQLNELEVTEYVFYINHGERMVDLLKGCADGNEETFSNKLI